VLVSRATPATPLSGATRRLGPAVTQQDAGALAAAGPAGPDPAAAAPPAWLVILTPVLEAGAAPEPTMAVVADLRQAERVDRLRRGPGRPAPLVVVHWPHVQWHIAAPSTPPADLERYARRVQARCRPGADPDAHCISCGFERHFVILHRAVLQSLAAVVAAAATSAGDRGKASPGAPPATPSRGAAVAPVPFMTPRRDLAPAVADQLALTTSSAWDGLVDRALAVDRLLRDPLHPPERERSVPSGRDKVASRRPH